MPPSDLQALARLVCDHAAALALYARQWAAASAEDVVQEALTALLTEKRRPDDPIAWMYRAVRNRAIDYARADSSRRRREANLARERGEWFEPKVDAVLDAQVAEAALQQLDADHREIVIMRIWGQLGFAQIAQIAGVSVSTVHGRYEAALQKIRNILEKSCEKKIH
jgi:RNA polymerase sigma factor (sigma-70 family)